MSQRQEERRERAQAELYERLDEECKPLRDRIEALKAKGGHELEIDELQRQISDIYSPHEDFLTKL